MQVSQKKRSMKKRRDQNIDSFIEEEFSPFNSFKIESTPLKQGERIHTNWDDKEGLPFNVNKHDELFDDDQFAAFLRTLIPSVETEIGKIENLDELIKIQGELPEITTDNTPCSYEEKKF